MNIQPPGHPFEHPDYVNWALKDFKQRNWGNKSIKEVQDHYRKTFWTVPISHVKLPKDTMLFRARPNMDHDFGNLNEIGIVPNTKVKSLGRANISNQSIFYVCTDEESAIREVTQWYLNDSGKFQNIINRGLMNMKWNPNTAIVTLSAWHVKEDMNIALLFNSGETLRSQGIQEIIQKRAKMISGQTSNYHKSFHMLLDFFSNEYGNLDVKTHLDYVFSAYYAQEIYNFFDRSEPSLKFDGVQYASVANGFRGENYALTENAFKNKIDFLGANICYAYNSVRRDMGEDKTVLHARFKTAILQNDNSFIWANSEEDVDYLIKVDNEYYPFKMPSDGSKFNKSVIRIG